MIYLASRSPRRAELLRQIGVEYQVYASDIDERQLTAESPEDYVSRLAQTKARVAAAEIAQKQASWVVLAADTTVAIDGEIIGKPADSSQCRCFLRRLSAREHLVLTAVAVATNAGLDFRLTRNRVKFRELSEDEIASYCESPEPMDKAGAYAIQGKAAVFVERLEGSYSAVMGLPLCETAELLRAANIEIF
ncbi:MAG TPA: Maf family protein [Gammaproteobacteria bacterium]|nr:Maf family protein [Gammaproteobacteria bacterium]